MRYGNASAIGREYEWTTPVTLLIVENGYFFGFGRRDLNFDGNVKLQHSTHRVATVRGS